MTKEAAPINPEELGPIIKRLSFISRNIGKLNGMLEVDNLGPLGMEELATLETERHNHFRRLLTARANGFVNFDVTITARRDEQFHDFSRNRVLMEFSQGYSAQVRTALHFIAAGKRMGTSEDVKDLITKDPARTRVDNESSTNFAIRSFAEVGDVDTALAQAKTTGNKDKETHYQEIKAMLTERLMVLKFDGHVNIPMEIEFESGETPSILIRLDGFSQEDERSTSNQVLRIPLADIAPTTRAQRITQLFDDISKISKS